MATIQTNFPCPVSAFFHGGEITNITFGLNRFKQ